MSKERILKAADKFKLEMLERISDFTDKMAEQATCKLSEDKVFLHYKSHSQTVFIDLVRLMLQGLSYHAAFEIVCKEQGWSSYQANIVFSLFNMQRRCHKRACLMFTAKKMKKQGYSRQEIADVLEVSTKTIDRLLKANYEINFS
ncbi:MAG: hypothetical protein ACI4OW_04295 [Alphaproteobacteria bacterium]